MNVYDSLAKLLSASGPVLIGVGRNLELIPIVVEDGLATLSLNIC